jgi:hypothetical protein
VVGTIQWGDVPTWVAALGTVGAVAVALVLAGRDGRRRIAQERRRQAELVTAWVTDDATTVTDQLESKVYLGLVVQNSSTQLVYQLIASLVATQGAYREDARDEDHRFRTYVGDVPPGSRRTRLEYGGHGMSIRLGVEIAFQDAGGRWWRRKGNGNLEQLKLNPVDFYRVPRPVPWETG